MQKTISHLFCIKCNFYSFAIQLLSKDGESDRKGKSTASYNYYNCLMTRAGAYGILIKILEENKQMGAVRILRNGGQNFGVPKNLDGFNDMEIDVQGKNLKIKEFFPAEKLDLVQQIFRHIISEQELYDTFVIKQKKLIFATIAIPPQPPIYIPRFLSNRIDIHESGFKIDCPEVFVFRNSIERYKLSDIAKPRFTEASTSQLNRITSRFIYLDEYQDWIVLKNSAKVPIHLINYEVDQKIYILEKTSGSFDILSKIGSKKHQAYLSEDDFVKQQLSEVLKISSVCICDTPDMGKTFLLANKISRVA